MSVMQRNLYRVGSLISNTSYTTGLQDSVTSVLQPQRSLNTQTVGSTTTMAAVPPMALAVDPNEPSSSEVELRIEKWEKQIDTSQLSEADLVIHKAHTDALKAGEETYSDPTTGFKVFTVLAHLKRGSCCGNLCRHCPYNHENVDKRYKSLTSFNNAFYS